MTTFPPPKNTTSGDGAASSSSTSTKKSKPKPKPKSKPKPKKKQESKQKQKQKQKSTNKKNNNKSDKKSSKKEDEKCSAVKKLIGIIIGAFCLLLYFIAMAVNEMSVFTDPDLPSISVTCRWNEVYGCLSASNCRTVQYSNKCDDCSDNCGVCNTMHGGNVWVAFNILSFLILFIAVLILILHRFVAKLSKKLEPAIKWMKFLYIVCIVLTFLALVSWLGSNVYGGSCYEPDVYLTLGASNIIDIFVFLFLIVGFILLI